MTTASRFGLALVLFFACSQQASAQAGVSAGDIQRLQESIYDASRDITSLRGRDQGLASQLENELDGARDETIYLKVKLQKREPVARSEYADLRDRIEGIRSRAQGMPTPSRATDADRPRSGDRTTRGADSANDVPVGTELDVSLQKSLSSATGQVEDRIEATTVVDLVQDGRVIIPAGSLLRGTISSVMKAGRIERTGSLTLIFDDITIRARRYPIRATVAPLVSEGIKGEAGKIGAGAGVGAILGGILGGFKGALAGILIGGGGTMAATDGKDIELPAGTVIRVRLDSGLKL